MLVVYTNNTFYTLSLKFTFKKCSWVGLGWNSKWLFAFRKKRFLHDNNPCKTINARCMKKKILIKSSFDSYFTCTQYHNSGPQL